MTTKPISSDFSRAIRDASIHALPPSERATAPEMPEARGKKRRTYTAPSAYDGELSSEQRATLARLARLVWKRVGSGETFDDWRRETVFSITGRQGLRDCTNQHFLPLRAHFNALIGNDVRSYLDTMRTGKAITPSETVAEQEQALHLLRDALAARGLSEAYAAAIARQRFKRSALEHCSARDAMSILFEIRRLWSEVSPGNPPFRRPRTSRRKHR